MDDLGANVVTDGLGHFAFVDVPPVELFIRFKGLGTDQQLVLPTDDPGCGLRVELVRSGTFVLERDGAGRAADTLRVLDGDEQRLPIELDRGPGRTSNPRDVPVPASGEVRGRVSELARWLVLYAGERELGRLPLVVRFGEDARLRW
ncbi:MAG: hypothetical protein EXS08_06765 [Planctomycetes bacterium]|nr:hypothetical protein [Planctomycetota bacterium]